MSNIKEQILTLVKQRHHSHKVALEQEKDLRSKHAIDLIARMREDSKLIELIDSLSEEKPSYVTDSPGDPGNPGEPGISDLEEAAEEYADKHGFRVPYDGSNNYYDDVDVKASKAGFIAGAEWQKEQLLKGSPLPEDTVLFQKGVEEGKRLEREESHENYVRGYANGYKDAEKQYNESVAYHYPDPVPPGVAYKSPQCYTDVMVTPNTQSGTSTLKAER